MCGFCRLAVEVSTLRTGSRMAIMNRALLTTIVFAATASLAGCYNSAALVDEVRSHALRTQTREINLGIYRTTMPRDPDSNSLTEIELRLFGTVPQYKISAIQKQLKADGTRLRYETLTAIRRTTAGELGEPDLGQLRSRLMQVANNVIKDAPIKSIGVEAIRIVEKR